MRDRARRRSVRAIALVAGALVLFVTGMAVRSAVDGEGHDLPKTGGRLEIPKTPAGAEGDGPTTVVAGVPAGYSQSEAGARAAALTFASVVPQQMMYAAHDEVVAMVEATSASGASEVDAADVAASVAEAQAALAAGRGDAWWVLAPLAVRVDAYDGDRAEVSVWVVRVVSRPGVATPQASWVVTTLELVWERGDWRVWSARDTPGPTPANDEMGTPASAVELDERLDGFGLVKEHR